MGMDGEDTLGEYIVVDEEGDIAVGEREWEEAARKGEEEEEDDDDDSNDDADEAVSAVLACQETGAAEETNIELPLLLLLLLLLVLLLTVPPWFTLPQATAPMSKPPASCIGNAEPMSMSTPRTPACSSCNSPGDLWLELFLAPSLGLDDDAEAEGEREEEVPASSPFGAPPSEEDSLLLPIVALGGVGKMRMFSGLISLCVNPARCMVFSASKIDLMIALSGTSGTALASDIIVASYKSPPGT
jgi:hypothetical protein